MAPDYRRSNPYQALLAKALEGLGATVSFPRGYRRVFPLRRMLGQDGRRPDVLHLHWLAPYLKGRNAVTKAVYAAKFILDVLLVRCAGVRVVWTVHNLVGHEQTRPGIELWCRRRLVRQADAINVHSARAKDLVAETYRVRAERISVIPHGHYRDVYGPPIPSEAARNGLGLSQEGRVFLFFGMIRPYKGVLNLLTAWASSTELQERHTLVIAGEALDPEYMEKVRSAADATHGVRLFFGRVPDDQVAALFSAADVVVLPFERALTSGSLVLAQSFDRPVITSNLAGLAETAGDISCVNFEQALVAAIIAAGGAAPARSTTLPDWLFVGEKTLQVCGSRVSPPARTP
jgi:glycosyltransferase involved in cell wall biosynthesis